LLGAAGFTSVEAAHPEGDATTTYIIARKG
jgi:hypothetical protein